MKTCGHSHDKFENSQRKLEQFSHFLNQTCVLDAPISLIGHNLLGKHRSSSREVFLRKDVLKVCSKCTGEHPCRNVISIKWLCNFIEIALRHGCSPVNLPHIFRTPFPKNTSGGLILNFEADDPLNYPCKTFYKIKRIQSSDENSQNYLEKHFQQSSKYISKGFASLSKILKSIQKIRYLFNEPVIYTGIFLQKLS